MPEYNQEERKILLQIAHDSIVHGLTHHAPLDIHSADFAEHLLVQRACFVTLHLNAQLRGCIGSLTALYPLLVDVSMNAFNAAFRDPRFAPVTTSEVAKLALEISVLSEPKPMSVNSEADLLSKLQPGVDGLILSDRGHHATFLPSVWEQLPDPAQFVIHLKNKAGLGGDYWSDSIRVETYSAEIIT